MLTQTSNFIGTSAQGMSMTTLISIYACALRSSLISVESCVMFIFTNAYKYYRNVATLKGAITFALFTLVLKEGRANASCFPNV